ncbi:hypothetical protein EUGRSUZ_E03567 [Eucalyptus grandis]|uniref:Uncharacterized protein n=2 Tax=Eucalyptus grandis TaxID=71139 RepID=A0A059C8Z9_EUCGR|nr:hypothetical protein EUGRSUZ_E03567 [Eucalyptus grandis]
MGQEEGHLLPLSLIQDMERVGPIRIRLIQVHWVFHDDLTVFNSTQYIYDDLMVFYIINLCFTVVYKYSQIFTTFRRNVFHNGRKYLGILNFFSLQSFSLITQ